MDSHSYSHSAGRDAVARTSAGRSEGSADRVTFAGAWREEGRTVQVQDSWVRLPAAGRVNTAAEPHLSAATSGTTSLKGVCPRRDAATITHDDPSRRERAQTAPPHGRPDRFCLPPIIRRRFRPLRSRRAGTHLTTEGVLRFEAIFVVVDTVYECSLPPCCEL
jgi:hypothetical protein